MRAALGGRALRSDGRSRARAHTDSLLFRKGDIKSLLAYIPARGGPFLSVLQPQRMKFLNTWGWGCSRPGAPGLSAQGGQGRCKSAPTWPQAAPGRQPPVSPGGVGGLEAKKTSDTGDPQTHRLPDPALGFCFAKVSALGVRRDVLSGQVGGGLGTLNMSAFHMRNPQLRPQNPLKSTAVENV